MNTLEFLKQQKTAVDAQIAPLVKLSESLGQQIDDLETTTKLAAYGLAINDPVAITEEFMTYCHFTQYERDHRPTDTLYIAGLHFGQPRLSFYKGGGGVAFSATFEMAQRMKALYVAD